MGSFSKKFSLLLVVILAVSSLIMVESAAAQTIPKPNVPSFTVNIVDQSYDVPATSTSHTDPYTGKTTITNVPGYHVTNKSIELKIKNQLFTPYTDTNGNYIGLYYNISTKPHYGNDWTYYPDSYLEYPASSSDYTVKNFGFSGYSNFASPHLGYVTPGGEVDFRIQAMIGYTHNEWVSMNLPDHPLAGGLVTMFTGQSSGWSNTQTITIPDISASASPNPTPLTTNTMASPTPTVPEAPSWTIPLLPVIMLASAGLLVYHKKHKHN